MCNVLMSDPYIVLLASFVKLATIGVHSGVLMDSHLSCPQSKKAHNDAMFFSTGGIANKLSSS